jgi:hypothetical protein
VLDLHLEFISKIGTLQQICIGSDVVTHETTGYWLIDHELMLRYLRNLPRLKTIAFTRDTYPRRMEDYNPESHQSGPNDNDLSYYEIKWYNQIVINPSKDGLNNYEVTHAWEINHQQRMYAIFNRYQAVFPELETMFLGQVTFVYLGDSTRSFEKGPYGRARGVDDHLDRTFG